MRTMKAMRTMDANSTRLLVEAVIVTVAVSAVIGVLLYEFSVRKRGELGTVNTLQTMVDEMTERMATYERRQTRDHLTMLNLATDLERWKIHGRRQTELLGVMAGMLRNLGATNIPTMPVAPEDRIAQPSPTSRVLPVILASLFDRDEMDDLAFRLGIDPGQIAGDTVPTRARALVRYVDRRGRLDELIELARSLRPEGEI